MNTNIMKQLYPQHINWRSHRYLKYIPFGIATILLYGLINIIPIGAKEINLSTLAMFVFILIICDCIDFYKQPHTNINEV